jgi:hypothetical protein
MNDRERFVAIAKGQATDYVPIFGFPGAPGMSWGVMRFTHDRLVATGMPATVGGCIEHWKWRDVEGWMKYWGTTGPAYPDFGLAWGETGFKTTTRIEGEFEIVESESGELTRQVIRNDSTYSMPEYIRYPVRDRASWEFFKERMTPTQFMPLSEVRERAAKFRRPDKPMEIPVYGAYGFIRGLFGPEKASYMFYDDPELIHEMMAWRLERARQDAFPLIEALKPDIVGMGEDLCYNHGMLLSPAQFDKFFGSYYQEVCDCAKAADVPVVAVDTDGNAMEFAHIAARYGVNAICPFECKSNNDLFRLRSELPEFLMFGWLEKEVVNEGNERMIEPEIMRKVPALLEKGRYFPNGDHGIQPMVTFDNLCRFMTILHEVCGNPEGDFPRK